ncbi:MAG: HEAT repeat domain-containing protein [Candidatus Hydrogenedentes bacterium]|nr:HEAT repeat domain-containing protein [Candidatus Hydrogenedentota bacterium]
MTRKFFYSSLATIAMLLCHAAHAQSTMTEDQCIEVILSDAGWQPKYEACTRLRQIGTAKSVPALATLLQDERLSHMARYALEPMPYPESAEALRDALKKAREPQKTGIITSLGVKRDAQSVRAIAKALRDDDADVARAAAGALGRIGTPMAAAALVKAQLRAPAQIKNELYEGMLACAEQHHADGKPDMAAGLYFVVFHNATIDNTRFGAFRGLAHALPAESPALLTRALGGSPQLKVKKPSAIDVAALEINGQDPALRDFAAQVVAEVPGSEVTAALVAALPSLPPAGQTALLRGLGDRKDPAAHAAVVAAMGSTNAGVKQAAVTALAKLGTAEDVASLTALLASDNADIANAAKTTLSNMKAEGVDTAITAALPNVAPAQRAALVDMLSERMAVEAVPVALASLNDADAGVRAAGLRTLTKLGTQVEAPAVIATLKGTQDGDERTDASNALNAIASQAGDALLPVVLNAMKGAAPESRAVLLRSLGRIGTPQALGAAVAALRDGNTEVGNEAVRVIAGWPTADAAPHLLKIAQGGNAAHKDAALRGYVRLAQAEQDGAAKAAMLSNALVVAKSPEEKWLVLPAWGAIGTKQSLDVLTPMLADPAVKNEAATALISAATAFAKADPASKPAAVAAINAVLAATDDTAIRERAQKTLEGLK